MEDLRTKARDSLIYKSNRFYGICEVLRVIYDLIHDCADKKLKEDITEKLIDAMVMAKKMNDRLIYYKTTYNDNTGSAGKNIKELPGTNKIRVMRRKRW